MRVQCISPHNYPPCVCVCAHVCAAQTGSLRANGLSSKDCECTSELGDACTAISAPPEARSDPSSPSVEPVASMPAAVADAPVDDSTPAGASPSACDACCLSLCALASRVSRCFSSDSPCESSPMSVVFVYCARSRVPHAFVNFCLQQSNHAYALLSACQTRNTAYVALDYVGSQGPLLRKLTCRTCSCACAASLSAESSNLRTSAPFTAAAAGTAAAGAAVTA